MSMSTHVVGYKPADAQWKKFKKIWEDCEAAKVSIPKEILEYFDHVYPGDLPGMEVEIKNAAQEYFADDCSGYEVDIDELPKDVKIIRFIISY